jgi:hypothetical protein
MTYILPVDNARYCCEALLAYFAFEFCFFHYDAPVRVLKREAALGVTMIAGE